MSDLKGKRVGIFAMDPGQTTGLAVGAVTLKGSSQEIFERDPLRVLQIECWDPDAAYDRNEVKGVSRIAGLFYSCRRKWEREGIDYHEQFLVYEDFNLRGQVGSTDRSGISPVRVIYLLMGMLHEVPVHWVPQQPSMAKTRWTNDRLRRAGLWTVGLEHGRDATRHAALWVTQQF